MRWWKFIVPGLEEFGKLCNSYDKTYMFLMIVVRLIIYLSIFITVCHDRMEQYKNIKLYGCILLVTIILFNVLSVLTLFFREPYITKKDCVPITEEREFQPIKYYASDLIDKDPPCPFGYKKIR